MLLEEEYSLGSRLSRVHRRHSDVLELIFIPGNVSMQVEQVGMTFQHEMNAWQLEYDAVREVGVAHLSHVFAAREQPHIPFLLLSHHLS